MSRLIYGPLLSGVEVPDLPNPPDVVISEATAAARDVTVTVPTFDPTTATPPINLHACYVTTAPDTTTVTADAFLASVAAEAKASAPVTGTGGPVTIRVPKVPKGSYFVQVVVEYAS